MALVLLSTRAERDLRRLQRSADELERVRGGIDALREGTATDVVHLRDAPPWRRLRVGDWRILFRPLEPDEGDGYLVARVVNRRDLERAVGAL